MKIVADENIPLVDHYFGSYGELLLKPGRLITRDDLFDADILLVRSVTRVNKLLLHDTPVKYVGSTTAGADHMDTEWLDQSGIKWGVAPGCNATAVAEYVVCVIAALQKQDLLMQSKPRAAVIGVGYVGRLVVKNLKALGFEVLECDPLRADKEKDFCHTAVENIQDVDFISVHTPLTKHGKFATYHLIDKEFLTRQKSGCVLLNAGRGEVVSFKDLKQYGKHLTWCLDVWEDEPHIDLEVLRLASIATPHIAGYTIESKIRGIEMIYQHAIDIGIVKSAPGMPELLSAKPAKLSVIPAQSSVMPAKAGIQFWQDKVLSVYDPRTTSEHMKNSLLTGKESFDHLRKTFPERHEF